MGEAVRVKGKSLMARVTVAAAVAVLVVVALRSTGQAASIAAASTAGAEIQCTNTAADSATIASAIAASAPGDRIAFHGTCLVTSTIELLGDRAYSGDSRTGTVLRQAPGANLQAVVASDSWVRDTLWTGTPFSLRHLTIDANKDANPGSRTNGLAIRSWQTVVEDVQVVDAAGSGIVVTNLSRNGTALTNTQVNGRIAGNVITGSGGNGVLVLDTGNAVTDWQLVDNWIGGSGMDGLHLDNAAGWHIGRNHIYGVGGNAIYAHRLFGTSITDNYVEDFGRTGTHGVWHGINATVQGDAASTIAGNRVFAFGSDKAPGSTHRFIAVSQVNYGAGLVAVTGNTIKGAGTAKSVGLYYARGSGTGLTVASTGNLVTGVATPRSVVGPGVSVTAGL